MRRLFLLAAVLALALDVHAAAVGKRYNKYGPNGSQCEVLYPNADTQIQVGTPTGSATQYGALGDVMGATDADCTSSGDDSTTYITIVRTENGANIYDLTDCTGCAANKILYVHGQLRYERCGTQQAGTNTCNFYVRSGGVDSLIGACTPGTSSWTTQLYTTGARIYNDPATGLPWTAAAINALQIKIDHPTSNRDMCMTFAQLVVVYETPRAPTSSAAWKDAGGN